jgi:hypothetical protein
MTAHEGINSEPEIPANFDVFETVRRGVGRA